MDDLAINISHLSKGFKLPHERQNTLKGALVNFSKRGYERQHVLEDLSIEVKKGEFLGILGRNGSGKSTLLKTLSGIYTPDKGSITINGKLTPFIELGVGFNPELSGRDNVFLNGALLGFSRREVAKMYDDIVSFAELERFMDQKLKNYSSGMQVRLAFSVAIQANTDILVLDEVLAVGDEAFQRKCYDYFNELKANGKTVILVTHDMSAVRRFCTRALVLNAGKVIYDGDTESATDVYRNLNLTSTEASIEKVNKQKKEKAKASLGSFIQSVTTLGADSKRKVLYKPKDAIIISCTFGLSEAIDKPSLQLWFNNPGGTALAAIRIYNKDLKKESVNIAEPFTVNWVLEGIFNDGKYLVTAEVSDEATTEVLETVRDACEFSIVGWDLPNVLVHPKRSFEIKQQG
jgi:ABC-type polysaccharide/polyol phosphate transport system ATPase subunit